MFEKNLIVISDDSKFIADKNSLSSLFRIEHQSTPPSLIKLFFQKNTLYMYDASKKRQFPIKYILTKLLGKRHSKFNNIESLLNQAPKTKVIFVAHDASIGNIYSYHYNWNNSSDACIFVVGIMDTTQKDESAKYEKFTEQLFINNKITPFYNFNGKILVTNRTNPFFIKALSQKFPNASEIQIQLVDYMEASKYDTKNRYLSDLNITKSIPKVTISSYSKSDALALGLQYLPNSVNFKKLRNLKNISNIRYDVFFAGTATGNRFEKIKRIISILDNALLSYYFILTRLSSSEQEEISKLSRSKFGKISFSSIPYENILTISSCSIALLDLYRLSPNEGFSFRIAEAFGLNCKIISDRTVLLEESFYSSENILVSENLSFSGEELIKFIKCSKCQYNETKINIFNIKACAG